MIDLRIRSSPFWSDLQKDIFEVEELDVGTTFCPA
jgi:hypothetical protein